MFNSVPLNLLQGSSSPGNFKLGVFFSCNKIRNTLFFSLCSASTSGSLSRNSTNCNSLSLGHWLLHLPVGVPTRPWLPRTSGSKTGFQGTSLVVQWLRLHLPMQGVLVQSLAGELGSHMHLGQKKKTKYSQENPESEVLYAV